MADENDNKENKKVPRDFHKTIVIPSGSLNPLQMIFDQFMAQHGRFGFQHAEEDVRYIPLPYKPDEQDFLLTKKPWRLMLELYTDDDKRMVIGIDLYGDLIFGRGESRPGRIILDLDPFGAEDFGVSREHAMLRPTSTRLYLIDQGSTNRTSVNGATSGAGVATTLKNEDMINLGNMVIMLRIIRTPQDAVSEEDGATTD